MMSSSFSMCRMWQRLALGGWRGPQDLQNAVVVGMPEIHVRPAAWQNVPRNAASCAAAAFSASPSRAGH